MSDAKYWWYDNLALNKKGKGYNSGTQPKADSIIVWQRGKCGHVAYVEQVDGDRVLISESNYDGKGSYRAKWYTLQEIKNNAQGLNYGYIYLKEPYKATVKVTSVKLNKTSLSLIKGKTSTLTSTISPSDATNKDVTWTSSNKKIATVDSKVK